ncbi:MAG TPA: hypothetical protein DDY57_10765 [Franconibacter pulveris]|nr:hypothetical protein [Franconibacter pulveris]
MAQWLIHLLMSAPLVFSKRALHKLRMTHIQVPAVQLLIIALLFQAQGETLSKAPPHSRTKAG